jgi:rhodanese-related sulfurtransferase
VRQNQHYVLGHVPEAKNILYTKLADAATDLSGVPKDKLVVVYCYTGHTGGVGATVLGAMGYNAKNMKYGMCAWTDDATVRATLPFTEAAYPGYSDVETTAHDLTTDYGLPTLDVSDSSDPAEIIRAACDAYLNKFDGTGVSPVMEASALHARNFEDGDTSNDYFVLSARTAAHYAVGHVTGAYNIPWNQVAKVDNLKKLPRDKKIVVYCYTGHTGAIAATALGILGYDTVNLKHGMMSWTKDVAVRVQSPFSEENDCKKYAYETGSGK